MLGTARIQALKKWSEERFLNENSLPNLYYHFFLPKNVFSSCRLPRPGSPPARSGVAGGRAAQPGFPCKAEVSPGHLVPPGCRPALASPLRGWVALGASTKGITLRTAALSILACQGQCLEEDQETMSGGSSFPSKLLSPGASGG